MDFTDGTTQQRCIECKTEFSSLEVLQAHLKHHHMILSCVYCAKTYRTRAALYSHSFVHSTTPNFRCDEHNCDRSFKSPKQLAAHRSRCHVKEHRFVCEHCGYRTSIQCNLLVHQRTHSGEKPYCCELCGKCFAALYQLNVHRTTHGKTSSSAQLQYCCETCGAQFAHSKTLYHHKTLHLAQKKYVCQVCGRAFAQAAGLCSHKRLHRAME